MIMKAVDENKLQLSDNLSKFFPEVPNADKITMAHLLGHRSGIHNFTSDAAYQTWQYLPKTDAEMIAIIASGGSDFTPGSKSDYSNANYVLLSQILQKVYKMPYREILTQKIIKPLGLVNTSYGGKIAPQNNEAYSFNYEFDWEAVPETDMSIPSGAGAIISTSSDVARFYEALLDGKIISAQGLGQMKTMQDKYGLGLFEMNFNGKTSYGHTGGIDSFMSIVGHFPEQNLTYAILSNGANYDLNNISKALLSSYFNILFEVPVFTTYTYSNPEDLEQYAGTYAAADFPMKITIARKGTALTAQATGQSAFPLEASELHYFKFDPAGIVLVFDPGQRQMILKQGGRNFTLTKE